MKCGYCDTCSEHLLATCQTCQEHFCNNESQPTSLSHILRHIKDTKHNSFSFPDKGIVQCSQCDRKNITTLYQDIDSSLLCIEHKNDDCVPIVLGKKVLFMFHKPQHFDIEYFQQIDQNVVGDPVLNDQQDIINQDLNSTLIESQNNKDNITMQHIQQEQEIKNELVPVNDSPAEKLVKIRTAENTINSILMKIIQFKQLLEKNQLIESKKLLDEMDNGLSTVSSLIEENLCETSTEISNKITNLQKKLSNLTPLLTSCHTKHDATSVEFRQKISKMSSQKSSKNRSIQRNPLNQIPDKLDCQIKCQRWMTKIETQINEFFELTEEARYLVLISVTDQVNEMIDQLQIQTNELRDCTPDFPDKMEQFNLVTRRFNIEKERLVRTRKMQIAEGKGAVFSNK